MAYEELQRDLDKCKSEIFTGTASAFFGSLLCNHNIIWSERNETAWTNGLTIGWNPEWFKSLSHKSRVTVLLHELNHTARLHIIRGKNYNSEIWNMACDFRVNNDLLKDNYSFSGLESCLKNKQFDIPKYLSEEDIYDILIKNPPSQNYTMSCDMQDGDNDPTSSADVVNAVIQSVQQAKMCQQAGSIPGNIVEIADKFLNPIIPWQRLLKQYLTDVMETDYKWNRPNKRYHDVYLPSLQDSEGRLEHLIYFLDVSGSVTEKELIRFNSEVKYIFEELQPQKLSLIQFDHMIQKVTELEEGDIFQSIEIIGRGGTSLVPVREYIIEHNPTAAIIFSDMLVHPMEPLPRPVPIIWIASNNGAATVPFGKIIYINE